MAESRNVLGQIERLKRHLEPELSDVDVARLVRGAAQRRERTRVRRSLGVGLGLGAAATAALSLFLHLPQREGAAVATSQPPVVSDGGRASSAPRDVREAQSIVLADASRALALEPGTEIAVEEDSPALVQLRLDRGRARFDVTPRTERSFEVRAGKVLVKVVGTVFDVEVVADRVGVSVEKGMVVVDWGRGQKRLSAGEHGWFPPVVLSDGAEAAGPDTAAHASGGGKGTSSRRAAAAPPTEPNVQDLFAQADSQRARGNPARAAELLKQILREYPEDPRASLAAFTLGRVLLNELARPREAAAAFYQVREKAPASQFAEDALAREIDAWKRASEPERARALATQYLERYPSGRHAQRVRILLGLK
jgi:transmembrane sensor